MKLLTFRIDSFIQNELSMAQEIQNWFKICGATINQISPPSVTAAGAQATAT